MVVILTTIEFSWESHPSVPVVIIERLRLCIRLALDPRIGVKNLAEPCFDLK